MAVFLSSHQQSHRHHQHRHHHHHHHHQPRNLLWHDASSLLVLLIICLTIFSNIAHAGYPQASVMKLSHGPQSESIFMQGERMKDDRLIFNHSIVTHSVFKTAAVRNVHYPPDQKSGYKISYIQVIDRTGYTSRVSVAEGGIGYRHVTMRLISHQNTGLHYSIKLYTSEPMYFMDGVEVPPHDIQDILNSVAKINQEKMDHNSITE